MLFLFKTLLLMYVSLEVIMTILLKFRTLTAIVLLIAVCGDIAAQPFLPHFQECDAQGACSPSSTGDSYNWIYFGASVVVGGIAGYLAGNHKGSKGKEGPSGFNGPPGPVGPTGPPGTFTTVDDFFTITFTPEGTPPPTATFGTSLVSPSGVIFQGPSFSTGGGAVTLTIPTPTIIGIYAVAVTRTDTSALASPSPSAIVTGQAGIGGPIQTFTVPSLMTNQEFVGVMTITE